MNANDFRKPLRQITVWVGESHCGARGYLCAHVTQEGNLGSNLITRRLRNTAGNFAAIAFDIENALSRDLGFNPDIEYAGLVCSHESAD
jgi:hypothetical protein